MSKLATLTFTIAIDEDLDYDDDSMRELLLEVMADQSDHDLFPLIAITEDE